MTAERYTAVITGALAENKPGEYLYLAMSEVSYEPDGSSTLRRGRPPYESLGREISFHDFPEDCRRLILKNYRRLWNLQGMLQHLTASRAPPRQYGAGPGTGRRTMRANGFTHVSVHAHDLDESARFYKELFGMEEIPAPGFPFPVRWLRFGDLQLHLFQGDGPAPQGHHFGLDVDDFGATCQKAQEMGAQGKEGYFSVVYELPDGAAQLYLRDPAGNMVEVDWPDVSTLDRSVIGDTRRSTPGRVGPGSTCNRTGSQRDQGGPYLFATRDVLRRSTCPASASTVSSHRRARAR